MDKNSAEDRKNMIFDKFLNKYVKNNWLIKKIMTKIDQKKINSQKEEKSAGE